MLKHIAIALALALLASTSDAKPRKTAAPKDESSEVATARDQLKRARLNAKIAKAKDRVRKAIEACEQLVVDRCVEFAKPDGSTDCEDEALRTEFNTACLAQEGK